MTAEIIRFPLRPRAAEPAERRALVEPSRTPPRHPDAESIPRASRVRVVGWIGRLLVSLAECDVHAPRRLWVAAGCVLTLESLSDLAVELDAWGEYENHQAARAAYFWVAAKIRVECAGIKGENRD